MSKEDNEGKTFDATEMLNDLEAGVFMEKVSHALAYAAEGAVDHGRQAKVTLEFTIAQIGSGQQVQVSHKLSYKRPTKRGSTGEDDTASTPLYVGTGGRLTLMPENQGDFFGRPSKEEVKSDD